jgi:hypothetical protein
MGNNPPNGRKSSKSERDIRPSQCMEVGPTVRELIELEHQEQAKYPMPLPKKMKSTKEKIEEILAKAD